MAEGDGSYIRIAENSRGGREGAASGEENSAEGKNVGTRVTHSEKNPPRNLKEGGKSHHSLKKKSSKGTTNA